MISLCTGTILPRDCALCAQRYVCCWLRVLYIYHVYYYIMYIHYYCTYTFSRSKHVLTREDILRAALVVGFPFGIPRMPRATDIIAYVHVRHAHPGRRLRKRKIARVVCARTNGFLPYIRVYVMHTASRVIIPRPISIFFSSDGPPHEHHIIIIQVGIDEHAVARGRLVRTH